MKIFFYKYWVLYYILFFLLLGLLIYALLWTPNFSRFSDTINDLNRKLEKCKNENVIVDTVGSFVGIVDSVKVDNIINCDASQKSGGKGITTTRHELGNRSGVVNLAYNMENLPDQIKVIYDNVIVYASNGLVSGRNIINWNYNANIGKPTFCIVEISAPDDQTAWTYLLSCPQ